MNIYFSLGSNISSKRSNLNSAKKMLEMYVGPVIAQSKLYESEPWGNEEQNNFINQCLNWPLTKRVWGDDLSGFLFSKVSDLELGKIEDLDSIFKEIELLINDFRTRSLGA